MPGGGDASGHVFVARYGRGAALFPAAKKKAKNEKKVLTFLPVHDNIIKQSKNGLRKQKDADVAELADALDSGSSSLKRVQVQVLSSAPPGKGLEPLALQAFSFV